MSPDVLLYKSTAEFKGELLKDIKNLFPGDSPFFAGFGNIKKDAIAYRYANIAMENIYIINE